MCFFLSREAVHRHREIVAKRRRGVDAPLSAPRDRDGDRDPGGFKYAFAQNTSHFPSQRTKTKKGLHRPGIEPGSVPWQGTILPLDHRCSRLLELVFKSFTQLAIFGLIKPHSREKCQSVSLRSVPTKVLHSHHYHARTAAKTPLRTASASVFPGAPSRDGRSWHVWPPHVFDSSRAEAAWDARRERRVPRLTPRLAPRLGAAASQPRLTLRLALRLLPQLLPRARTLNPKPNNPPRFRVKLLFECLP